MNGAASDTFIGGAWAGVALCFWLCARGSADRPTDRPTVLTLLSPRPSTPHTAGWLTSIRNIKWQFQLLYGMRGIGNAVYIGAGGAIFINSYYNYKRLRYWRNWLFTYTVGGTGYKTKTTPGEVVRITKDKITVDYVDFNKHNGYFKCTESSTSKS